MATDDSDVWTWEDLAGTGGVKITGAVKGKSLGEGINNYTLTLPTHIRSSTLFGTETFTVTSIADKAFAGYTHIHKVSLPTSITTIGSEAFHGCSSLSIINLSNVTTINYAAFWQCTNLKNIYLTSIKNLDSSCFQNCTSLINITFSNEISKIGEYAFSNCTAIDVLTIPDSVTTIDESCFEGCSKLTSLSLGEGVTSIGKKAFNNCGLTSVFIPPQLSIHGIGDGAFLKESETFNVTMPNNYLNFDSGNTNLEMFKAKFQDNSWSSYYIFDTLVGEDTLTQNRVTEIANEHNITTTQLNAAFPVKEKDVPGIVAYIGKNVKNIGTEAFSGLYYLTTIYIGKTVETIGSNAFISLPNLENFYISDDLNSVFHSSLTQIESAAFQDCTSLSMLIIPTSVVTIGLNAFQGCIMLSDIISYSGSKLETIESYAFHKCSNVNIVRLPNSLITIGDHVFDGCITITNIIFPNTVKSIGSYAFLNCYMLQNITISEKIETIGENAFQHCKNLTMVKNIPYKFKENLKSIFNQIDEKESPDYTNAKNKWLSAKGQSEMWQSITSTANAILNSSMGNNKSISDVLGYFNSSGPKMYPTSWEPQSARQFIQAGGFDTLKSAKGWAREWARKYEPQYNGLVEQTTKAYSIFTAQTIQVSDLIHAAYIYNVIISSHTESTLTKEMVEAILGTAEEDILFSVTIDNSEDNKIDTIGEYAFTAYGKNITAITFSDKITAINYKAFKNCIYLNGKITLPETMVLIGQQAFQNCTGITSVYIPKSVTEIRPEAFSNTGLTNVLLFNSEVLMSRYAFFNCRNLTNVFVPPRPPHTVMPGFPPDDPTYWTYPELYDNLSNGENFVFSKTNEGYSNTINFSYRVYFTPDSNNTITHEMVKEQNPAWDSVPFSAYIDDVAGSHDRITIATGAFEGSSMTNLFIQGTTRKYIEQSAFKNCSKLVFVSLSDSVESIGEEAFTQCKSLITITIPSRLHTRCVPLIFSQEDVVGTTPDTSKFIFDFFCILSPSSNGILTSYDVNTQIGTSSGFTQGVSISFDSTVTIIENDAFNGNENIISLLIPPNVTSIGKYSFANCPNLTSVTYAPNSSLIFIDDYAFHNCVNLSSVQLPLSLETLGIGAFISCNNLWSVTLPYLFDCNALTETTNYFETTKMTGESWSDSDPTTATGTFFTFYFEHSNGLLNVFSYKKLEYITSQLDKYEAAEKAKEKKNAVWNKIGFIAAAVAMTLLLTIGVGFAVDAALATAPEALMADEGAIAATSAVDESAAESEAETAAQYEREGLTPDSAERRAAHVEDEKAQSFNNPGRQLARQRKLNAFNTRKIKNLMVKGVVTAVISQLLPFKKIYNGDSPFQFSPTQQNLYGVSTNTYIYHESGSWVIHVIMKTNRNDIHMSDLEDNIDRKIVSYLNDTHSQSNNSAEALVVHSKVNEYTIKITVDTDYDNITHDNKVDIENIIHQVLRPYENQHSPDDIIPSDICFSKNTPIVTDQGIVNIENINTSIHSIRHHPIHQITKSISMLKHLVCFEKDSMGKNYPSKRTIVSQEHNIYHGGKLVRASDLLDKYSDVHLVPYHGEILYNILMKNHDKVIVNNMICETLHPDNVVAKIYNNANEHERSKIFVLLKDHIKNKDYEKYMKYLNKIAKTVPNTIISQTRKPSKLMRFYK